MADDEEIDSTAPSLAFSPEEVTPENADRLLLEYFSVDPYTITWTKTNRMVRVPCDLPSIDGFCSRYMISPTRLGDMLKPETVEICLSKFKHIMMVNGTNRGYDAGFTALTMKNVAGWAEKSEQKTIKTTLDITDRILDMMSTEQLELIRQQVLEAEQNESRN